MLPFGVWEPIQSKDDNLVDTVEASCVRILANGLRNNPKTRKIKVQYSYWRKVFTGLLNDHSQEEVMQVLNWLIPNLGKQYVPRVESAKHFREKYTRIKEAMERDVLSAPTTEASEKIYKSICKMQWPQGLDVALRSIIQRTLNNYEPFWEKLKAAKEKLKEEVATRKKLGGFKTIQEKGNKRELLRALHADKMYRLLIHLESTGALGPPDRFTLSWMIMIQRLLLNWKNWNSNFQSLIFNTSSNFFVNRLVRVTHKYSRSSLPVYQLMKEIEDDCTKEEQLPGENDSDSDDCG